MSTASANKILTVTQLTFQIKSCLEPTFQNISVQGEISNLTQQSSGHIYFSLKDKNAQINAVLFKGNARNVAKLPKPGDQVTLKGEISVYAPRGNYQLIVRSLEYAGTGELLLKLHQLKEELKNLGWFDSQHKKSLPTLPKRIGVVTSPTGAVIQDILHVLDRRFSNIHLLLNPVKVQGEGAAEEIAQAITDFNKYKLCDVIIVGRGGGSLEDLWAFNEKIVAQAIFSSKIPIISAVGHETDSCIADFVADVRAPTPSAAAEIVMSEKVQLQKSLLSFKQQITTNLTQRLEQYKKQLHHFLKHPSLAFSHTLLGRHMQLLDDMQNQLDRSIKQIIVSKKEYLLQIAKQSQKQNPLIQIKLHRQKLIHLEQNFFSSAKNLLKLCKEKFSSFLFYKKLDHILKVTIDRKREKLYKLANHLASIDPKNLLKKGYSILFSQNQKSIILSTKQLAKQQKISALLGDGKFIATIEEIYHDTK